jgi:hypothetical protein
MRIRPIGLDPIPVGIIAGRESFAYAGRPVAESNVAIAPAGIAELRKTSVFGGLDKI